MLAVLPDLAVALVEAVRVHVAVLDVAAAGGDEEHAAVAPPAALEPVEHAPHRRPALVEDAARVTQVRVRRIGLGDVDPGHRQAPPRLLALARVVVRQARDREDLQPAAGEEIPRIVGAGSGRTPRRSRRRDPRCDTRRPCAGRWPTPRARTGPSPSAARRSAGRRASASPAPRTCSRAAGKRRGVAPGRRSSPRRSASCGRAGRMPPAQLTVVPDKRHEAAHERARARVVVERHRAAPACGSYSPPGRRRRCRGRRRCGPRGCGSAAPFRAGRGTPPSRRARAASARRRTSASRSRRT